MEATAGADTLRRDRVLSSRIYVDVPISKAPVIYSPAYDIAFNGIEKKHPFNSSKWGRVCSSLVDAGFLQNDRIVEPLEASEDDLLVVSAEGVAIRDEKVFRFAKDQNVPLLMLTSGGYMKSSFRVIADSIINLLKKDLIDSGDPGFLIIFKVDTRKVLPSHSAAYFQWNHLLRSHSWTVFNKVLDASWMLDRRLAPNCRLDGKNWLGGRNQRVAPRRRLDWLGGCLGEHCFWRKALMNCG